MPSYLQKIIPSVPTQPPYPSSCSFAIPPSSAHRCGGNNMFMLLFQGGGITGDCYHLVSLLATCSVISFPLFTVKLFPKFVYIFGHGCFRKTSETGSLSSIPFRRVGFFNMFTFNQMPIRMIILYRAVQRISMCLVKHNLSKHMQLWLTRITNIHVCQF